MRNDEINIAIAEICGWKRITRFSSGLHGWREPGPLEELPNYAGCLNAMNEAEKALITPVLEKKWIAALTLTVHGKSPRKHTSNKMVRASARQRAEAFLRVFDKWKEGA